MLILPYGITLICTRLQNHTHIHICLHKYWIGNKRVSKSVRNRNAWNVILIEPHRNCITNDLNRMIFGNRIFLRFYRDWEMSATKTYISVNEDRFYCFICLCFWGWTDFNLMHISFSLPLPSVHLFFIWELFRSFFGFEFADKVHAGFACGGPDFSLFLWKPIKFYCLSHFHQKRSHQIISERISCTSLCFDSFNFQYLS